ARPVMPVVAAQYCRSATATRSESPYTGPCPSLIPFVRHGVLVAFLLRDVSLKASSGNNLTASTREVVRLIVVLSSLNCEQSEPSELVGACPKAQLLEVAVHKGFERLTASLRLVVDSLHRFYSRS